jgi:hypothetical protein
MVPRWAALIGFVFVALGGSLLRLDVYGRSRPRPGGRAALRDWRLDQVRPFALIAVGVLIVVVALVSGK